MGKKRRGKREEGRRGRVEEIRTWKAATCGWVPSR